ncbi:DUF1214 domain-containing protein [Mycolicibacterium sp.]|uniref:DUF1214 domain-containing protein n=1 Tax=Mycolicibacterium sp. TaxID=2320850 RepID=UPI0028AA67C9|nr:DUF1214 domain-containing protein [Mycolicibacterium sp.]
MTHSGDAAEQQWFDDFGRASESPETNSDGSIDLYVGAAAPDGFEKNYMKTTGDDGWFVYFRLYAPLQPFFDKTFSLPDFEIIQ